MYSREIDGEILTISASGWTYDRLFVLYDYETGSIWYQLPDTSALTCIAGPYEGRELSEIVSAFEPWSRWKTAFPQSKLLKSKLSRPQ